MISDLSIGESSARADHLDQPLAIDSTDGLCDLAGDLLVGLPNESIVEDWPHIDRQGRFTWHLESTAARTFDSDEPLVTVTAADRL